MTVNEILIGIAMVLVIEGLVYALAPSLVERLLEALRALPVEARRQFGLTCVVAGIAMLWVVKT